MFRQLYRFRMRGWLIVVLALIATLSLSSVALGQGPSGSIQSIQVTQVLGKQSNKYVAGKDAVIRVFLSEATAVNPAEQQVVVKRSADTVATLAPTPTTEPTKILDFTCPNRAACGDWKAGDYIFEAKVGAATATANAKFEDRRALRVLAVPVKANYGPGDVRSPSEAWKKMGEYMKQVFPISSEDYKWIIGQEVDASADKFNLKTNDGMRETYIAIAMLQPQECFNNRTLPNCYDLIIGFVKDRQGAEGTIQGYTMGWPANVVTETDEDAPATVAHEVAHVYGIGDEYAGGSFRCSVNAPPSAYPGMDWDDRSKQVQCEKSVAEPFPVGTGGTIKANVDYPYEVGGRGALPDMISFMGSGAKQNQNWVTAEIWAWLYDQLAPTPKTAMLHKAAPSTPTRFLYATGFISTKGEVTTEPWYTFTDSTTLADTTGKGYSILAVDADGKTLASQALDVQFIPLTNPPKPVDPASFEVTIPFPEKTAAIHIVKGTEVLKKVVVTPNAPEVKILTPAAGEKVDGNYTIKWEGKDKDGDKLHYVVEYSDNGEDWLTLAVNITETEWNEDFSTIAGSDKPLGRIKITATDGINATEATSELFNVPPKVPEVYIDEPLNNATFKAGTEIALSGGAYDWQDDWLYQDTQLVWSSDVQGELGGGELLYLDNLKPGTHTITLRATNSFKLTGTAKVTITITDK